MTGTMPTSTTEQGEPQIRAILVLLRGLGDNYDDFGAPLDTLARIPVRTLIVLGDRDHAPTIEVAQELYRTLPDASLWVVPNAGHLPFWSELPGGSRAAEAAFSPVVLRFLDEGSSSEGPMVTPNGR